MIGMCRKTGKPLGGIAHLAQSLAYLFSTAIGSCLERRELGSEVPDLIDQPDHSTTRIRIFAAAAYAVRLWENRLRITRIQITSLAHETPGKAMLLIEGYTSTGETFSESVPIGGVA